MQKEIAMRLIVLCFIMVLAGNASAQTIERDEIDEFTGAAIKETSWEYLLPPLSQNVHFKVRSVDGMYYFHLKYMDKTGEQVLSVDKDDELMLKLENGEIAKLNNTEYTISCIGCGAVGWPGSSGMGIHIIYNIEGSEFARLLNSKIVKMRFYTNSGYIERDIKSKYAEMVQLSLDLIK